MCSGGRLTTATAVLVAASFIGAGAVAVRSAPRNRVGYLLGAVGLLWALAKFLPPGSPRALLAGAWLAVLAHLVLAHPSGRLAGPPAVAGAARHLAGAARVVMGLGYLHAAAFGVLGAVAVSGAGVRAATMVGVMAVGAAVVAVQVVRWRAASAARRRTMNPFFAAGVLSTAAVLVLKPAIVAGVVLPRATPLLQVVLALVPLAYLASLVRSRLDRGGVAALVRRLSRLDPREVDGALAKVLHDPTVRVGYWAPHERTYLDIDGSPVIVEGDRVAARVDRDGAPLALLVHDRAAGEDQELLGATCAALALALRNDRRRLERDLHDGLQQRLLSVPVTLGLAESALRGRPEHAVALIGEAKTTALDALTELRGLVQGIHPPVLTERADSRARSTSWPCSRRYRYTCRWA